MKLKDIQYWFNLYNIDLVNAKTGKVLTRTEKFINIIVNAVVSVLAYLLLMSLVMFLFSVPLYYTYLFIQSL